MIVVNADRATGKTTKLMVMSELTRTPILVVTKERAKYLIQQANILGYNIPTPICVSELENRKLHWEDKILVDDAIDVLEAILSNYGYKIDVATINFEKGVSRY